MEQVNVRRASSAEDMAGLRALRIEVFVREQGVPEELELDALDAAAVHAVALNGPDVVGTGRLLFVSGDEAQVGRMAVKATLRRHGIGSAILRFLEGEARGRGAARVVLHAQRYVSSFYHQRGYVSEGEPFMEAGIEHVLMGKRM